MAYQLLTHYSINVLYLIRLIKCVRLVCLTFAASLVLEHDLCNIFTTLKTLHCFVADSVHGSGDVRAICRIGSR